MHRTILATTAALSLAACAERPSAVAPAYVSPLEYSGISCTDLQREAARVSSALAQVTGQQQNAADADAAMMGVGMLILWPVLLAVPGGDHADELARLKGEADAINAAALRMGC
jgi:hypothetical protein